MSCEHQQITRLTLIRHGETDWNTLGRIQGHIDTALNARGMEQARRLAQALQDSDIDAIYTSDLLRAAQTARALQAALGVRLVAVPGLRERCFGALQGRTMKDMLAQGHAGARAIMERTPDYSPPGGESLLQFHARTLANSRTLAARHCGGHIAIVAHGGVLDMLIRQACGLDLQAPRSWKIENTSIHRMLWSNDQFTMLAWADVAHLDQPEMEEERHQTSALETAAR